MGETYLGTVEYELYAKFLNKLGNDDWDGCHQVIRLLEGLAII